MASTNWGPVTLNPGENIDGPYPAAGITSATLELDRTLGLNAAPNTTVLTISVMASNVSNPQPTDWYVLVGSTWFGGIYDVIQTKGGSPTQLNSSSMYASSDGSIVEVQVYTYVNGPAVTVGGTLTTTP